ncbi:hypothetical protein [Bartonella clarridgeiae]|nr:hypothetical protein [Bartonella clarridgeiae]WCR55096.1 MAG: type IV secretion system protein VirB5 precursor: 17-kDa antigen precursor [Bartonella clarridgeiae]WCR55120.1 MAG: type IV secretion system protein VirB5 precursor: 17-kDa antigen precursor [Bartonella clarridgeiae]WCR55632.1 MAG: type IV secretion system protein VirB5 precursor: 17-kDa antigen precursor [Bartonella clarridgeiae]
MKKIMTMLFSSLCFISHAVSQDVEQYYQEAINPPSNTSPSKIAETIYASAITNEQKIKEINDKILTADKEAKKSLQIELAILQSKLQVDALKLQAFSIIKSENNKSKEAEREEEQQKQHASIQKTLQEQLEQAKSKVNIEPRSR